MKKRTIKELELCIFEIGRFSDKIWAWEQQLFEKSGKNGMIPVCFLQSLFFFSGTRAGYFWQSGRFLTKYEHESFGFFMKSRKIRVWEQCLFDREEVYLTKYWHETISFFMKNRVTMAWEYFVFDLIITKYGHESSSFYMKNQGKLAWEQFVFVFVRGDVIITKYGHGASGFLWKIGKKGIRAVCFCRNGRLFSKMWAWEP